MSSILPILKMVVGGGAAATTVAAGGLGIYYHKDIGNFITSLVNNGEQTSNFVYAVVKYTAPTSGPGESNTLFKNTNQDFICQIDDETTDNACFLYKLPSASDTSISVDLETIKQEKNEVKEYSHLSSSTSKNFLVKLNKDFYATLNAKEGKTFKIVDKTTKKVEFGSFTLVSGIATENAAKNVTIQSSDIFVIKLTETISNASVADSDTLVCKIGTTGAEIPCKAYKLTTPSAIYAKTNLAALTTTLSSSELEINKHLLIDLQGASQTIADVENQVIVVKKTTGSANTDVAKGLVEQILIGSINATTPSSSELLIVENANSSLTTDTVDSSKHSYVLTKGGEAHKFLKTTTYTKDAYQCRVVVGNKKYDDTSCELYAFGEADETFVFDTSKLSGSNAITTVDALASTKYQVVKLSKTLQEKLKTLDAAQRKIEIIKKDRHTSAWNHRLLSLSHITDLVEGVEASTPHSSNLLLVRAKTKHTAANTGSIDSTTSVTCTIGADTTPIDCKLYKFNANQTTNIVKPSLITSLSDSITIASDFTANQYYAIELSGQNKLATDLQNKEIIIKHGATPAELGTVVFDQFIFGKAKTIGALASRKEHTYIVEKASDQGSIDNNNLPATYRCKLTGSPATNSDNFDFGCKITKISPTNTADTIISVEDLRANPTDDNSSHSWNLSTTQEGSYRLKLNLNSMYNIAPASFDAAEITIEVADGSKTYGKLKLIHDITVDEPFGKASHILGKVTEQTSADSLTAGKCNFTSTTTTTGEVPCTAYKNAISEQAFNTGTYTSAVATGETVEKDKYVLIKLTTPQPISALKEHVNVYYKPTDNTKAAATIKIEAILGGDNASGKKLYVLHKKAASA